VSDNWAKKAAPEVAGAVASANAGPIVGAVVKWFTREVIKMADDPTFIDIYASTTHF